MIVIIRAHPSGRVHKPFQSAFHLDGLFRSDIDGLLKVTVFDAASDDHFVFAWGQPHTETACFGMILVHATMGAVLRAEIR